MAAILFQCLLNSAYNAADWQRGENESPFTSMTTNSYKCHLTTIAWDDVTYKNTGKWQLGWYANWGQVNKQGSKNKQVNAKLE